MNWKLNTKALNELEADELYIDMIKIKELL
jgi:hypothetical protein